MDNFEDLRFKTYFGTPDLRMTAENIAGWVGPPIT